MRIKLVIIGSMSLLLLRCAAPAKITQEDFRNRVSNDYPDRSICFRVDESGKVLASGMYSYYTKKLGKDYDYFLANKKLNNDYESLLEDSFERGEDCDLVAISGGSGDSIYAAIVYPYKSNIEQSSEEYPRWFYEGRKYVAYIKDKKIQVDTFYIQHNPPVDNPWILEKNAEKDDGQ